jgi:dienelactone hydrolase
VLGDLSAAADLLVVDDGVTEVGVLGFCMGGMRAEGGLDRPLRSRCRSG